MENSWWIPDWLSSYFLSKDSIHQEVFHKGWNKHSLRCFSPLPERERERERERGGINIEREGVSE